MIEHLKLIRLNWNRKATESFLSHKAIMENGKWDFKQHYTKVLFQFCKGFLLPIMPMCDGF